MRKFLLGFAGLAVALVAPLAAHAACVAPISWGVTYATETNYTGNTSNPGSVLTIRGVIDCFSGSFATCANPDPAKEYSFVVTGLVSNGTSTFPIPNTTNTIYQTTYHGPGTYTIYEDATPDADPANPATYTDGTAIVTGLVSDMTVTFVLNGSGGFVSGNFDTGPMGSGEQFTGGTLFNCVSRFGQGCPFRLTGGWNTTPAAHPPGYTAEVAGKTDIDCEPTPTEVGTWGKVKSTYR